MKAHISNVFRRIGVADRTSAAIWACDHQPTKTEGFTFSAEASVPAALRGTIPIPGFESIATAIVDRVRGATAPKNQHGAPLLTSEYRAEAHATATTPHDGRGGVCRRGLDPPRL